MATTTNFGWETPDDTDLVKDGAAAIRTALSGVDTSFVDLKGGTSGQVLAKASNTDLDFAWTAIDPLVILDAKGDLITATAGDTPTRLAVGANGTILTADSAEATGLKWATPPAPGGMTQLATGTLSGAKIDLTSIPGTYKDLKLVLRNFRPVTDGDTFGIRFNNDSTSSRYRTESTMPQNNQAPNSSSIYGIIGFDNTTAQSLLVIDIPDYANAVTWKTVSIFGASNDNTSPTNVNLLMAVGFYNQTTAITQVNVLAQAGNMTSGTYILYGVN